MVRFYRAADLVEAHLLRDLLNANGIPCALFNTHAQGGAGQLPLTETYPEVWLERDSDLPVARALLAGRDSERKAWDVDRPCGHCGEANPGSFEVCWHCGAALR